MRKEGKNVFSIVTIFDMLCVGMVRSRYLRHIQDRAAEAVARPLLRNPGIESSQLANSEVM